MYAIIEDRGKQYKVTEGDTIEVDLGRDLELDSKIDFSRIIYFRNGDDIRVGNPTLDGIQIDAHVVDPLVKGKKIYVRHFRRRQDSKTKVGHRQKFTAVRIDKIAAS